MIIHLNHDEVTEAIVSYITSQGVLHEDSAISVEFSRKHKTGVNAEITISPAETTADYEEDVPETSSANPVNFDE